MSKKPPHFYGEEHPGWKGDNAGKLAMHHWVINRKGKPSLCEHCKKTDKKKYEWANVDHEYKRNLEDYIRLCTSCHRKYDMENNNYTSGIEKVNARAQRFLFQGENLTVREWAERLGIERRTLAYRLQVKLLTVEQFFNKK
ncbi:MAG: hypothetical protein WC803_12875 [Sphingomonas sp.]|jgi:hypothetical protein